MKTKSQLLVSTGKIILFPGNRNSFNPEINLEQNLAAWPEPPLVAEENSCGLSFASTFMGGELIPPVPPIKLVLYQILETCSYRRAIYEAVRVGSLVETNLAELCFVRKNISLFEWLLKRQSASSKIKRSAFCFFARDKSGRLNQVRLRPELLKSEDTSRYGYRLESDTPCYSGSKELGLIEGGSYIVIPQPNKATTADLFQEVSARGKIGAIYDSRTGCGVCYPGAAWLCWDQVSPRRRIRLKMKIESTEGATRGQIIELDLDGGRSKEHIDGNRAKLIKN